MKKAIVALTFKVSVKMEKGEDGELLMCKQDWKRMKREIMDQLKADKHLTIDVVEVK